MKLNKDQISFLEKKKYLTNGETIETRVDDILNSVKEYEEYYQEQGLSERCREWINKGYIHLSTPQLANVGRKKKEGDKTQPLPCSCNIITVPNSIDGIYTGIKETAMLSKLGAGVGANFMYLPDQGTQIDEDFYTNNKLDWSEDYIRTSQKVSQNAVRRGYLVPFDSIYTDHFWEYMERLDKNNPNKKDPFMKNNFGFILPIGFWERLKTDKEIQKRFITIIQWRKATGKIYLLDVENCNKNQSPVYEKLGHVVDSTNICTEVLTPSYDDKTFACIILSLGLIHWDEIEKNPQIIRDAYILLDIFVQMYIDLSDGIDGLKKARKSAMEKRDIGLGTMGLHDYFQSKGYSFGGLGSRFANKKIYGKIREIGEEVTKELGARLGSPKMCHDAGMVRRNVSLMMIAPNKTTAYLGSTSEGCQPRISNYYVNDLTGVEVTFKNPYLQGILIDKGYNTPDIWESILDNLGSVQHLEFLSEDEKSVFKTASEISPKDIIDLAADRQVFIDMAQSLNLFGRPNYSTQDVYDFHKYAFEQGIKTLYYYYPQAHAALEKDGEAWDTCESCAD